MITQLDDWSAVVPDRDGMDTRLDDWSPTLPDINQHIEGSMNIQVDICPPTVPSVSNLSSSLSAKCTLSPPRGTIDRFGSLPWFALEEILFHLPDLSTLHQLCQASPAVAEYLSDKVGIFPKVVEKIMDPWIDPVTSEDIDFRTIRHPDRGVIIDTSVFFRTLVYLWWKENVVATGVPADENPLPDDFNDVWLYHINIGLEGFVEPKKVGEIPLPFSTPPKILRYLLSLASRIRRDAHAFFHSAMDLFKSSKIEELSYKKGVWKENGTRRPRGVPIDSSNADWPLTWLEEQRIMQALLKPYIFSVLRRMVCETGLLKTNAIPPSPKRPDSTDTLQDLQKNALVNFWAPFSFAGMTGNEPLEQLETICTWKEGRRSHGTQPKRDAKFTTCCPKFSQLSDEQLKKGLWSLQHSTLPGPFLAQNSTHSVVRDAGLRGDFHKFGVSFWDMDRMLNLGLATHKMHREIDKKDLAFRWLTLLLSNKGPRKYGQKRLGRFRSRTKAIPVAK
ncbi:hypothetical protein N7537_002851 [Penicillium hordei]|uniref:F-box domain-containing protein n=1 Tax=Penicillium hordei TaxID=40994 RepID=A0AAD6EI35_9EURO|nr:uncharacterized protein N7537_002851 [Penicillium hordei]KAJ5617737.1 hypothetical protein N7537_002851 [Penicillium hordei]